MISNIRKFLSEAGTHGVDLMSVSAVTLYMHGRGRMAIWYVEHDTASTTAWIVNRAIAAQLKRDGVKVTGTSLAVSRKNWGPEVKLTDSSFQEHHHPGRFIRY